MTLNMFLRRLKRKGLVVVLLCLSLLAFMQIRQLKDVPAVEEVSLLNSWWPTWHFNEATTATTCRSPTIAATRNKSLKILDTADLYGTLNFDVQDGSKNFWNRTFEERYFKIRKTWGKVPLVVIVVPNSHIDPGWLRTYEEYYNIQVHKILDNMVDFLNKTPDFTFSWSEISYFSQWYSGLEPEVKNTVINLLKKNQLEITTGGWVMPDEATTHYWALIDQLIEGHQWLKLTAGFVPEYAWSVDVFGHSSSYQTLLSSAGLKGSVVLRTHYALKTFLAYTRSLDFYWEHLEDDSRILCHMAPSDLYSFKHACGPDPRVCLQYDFRRVQGEYTESLASAITTENVRPKAERLLEQYGRYASLYSHNVLLVPLGDDFRYDKTIEWEQQYSNYKTLFDYMNNHYKNVHVKFGTVANYFEEISKRTPFPLLRGDFLPYADIYAEGVPSYWTGFYTTRPFEKSLVRELEHWLRTAEILYTFALTNAATNCKRKLTSDYIYLRTARQSLDLFQHHDAITGTSREEVMRDYRERLHAGVKEAMGIISHSSQCLILPDAGLSRVPFTSRIYLNHVRTSPDQLTESTVTSVISEGRNIWLFNSLTFHRKDIVRIRVKSPYLAVEDRKGQNIPFQINPVWDVSGVMLSDVHELLFLCDIPPLSFTLYKLVQVPADKWDKSSKSEVSLHLGDHREFEEQSSIFSFKKSQTKDIIVESPSLAAIFTESGLLKELSISQNGLKHKVEVEFFAHLSTPHRSGAYLFHPARDGSIPLLNMTNVVPLVRLMRGKLMSEVTFTILPFLTLTTRLHTYRDPPKYLELEAMFDLSKANPMELYMQLKTGIKNGDTFYTDSNGLNMVRRKYIEKIPLQGNTYPAVTAVYIEDGLSRLNLLTSHSHGVISPNSGTIAIMMDRRINNDDARGLGEGVLDNKRTLTQFRLLLEPTPSDTSYEFPILTNEANLASLMMLYPTVVLVSEKEERPPKLKHRSFTIRQWPSYSHLVNLRTLSMDGDHLIPSNRSLLVILKRDLACNAQTQQEPKLENMDVNSLFVNLKSVTRTSLTGTGNYSHSRTLESYNVAFNAG